MLTLFSELEQKGILAWYSDLDYRLPFLLQAVALIRNGAMAAAGTCLRHISVFREKDVLLLKEMLPVELVVNAAAEMREHSFCGGHGLDLLWGALLGEKIGLLHDYFQKAERFYTRVVGIKYHLKDEEEIAQLTVGSDLVFWRDVKNHYDENAIAVYTKEGKQLGYLRKTLAAILAPQMDKGQQFKVKVAVVLDEGFDANERLNVLVERVAKAPEKIAE